MCPCVLCVYLRESACVRTLAAASSCSLARCASCSTKHTQVNAQAHNSTTRRHTRQHTGTHVNNTQAHLSTHRHTHVNTQAHKSTTRRHTRQYTGTHVNTQTRALGHHSHLSTNLDRFDLPFPLLPQSLLLLGLAGEVTTRDHHVDLGLRSGMIARRDTTTTQSCDGFTPRPAP